MVKETQYEGSQAYFYAIELVENDKVIDKMAWNNMPFKIYYRWMWYFKYRGALLQVNNPRLIVRHIYGMQKTPPDARCEVKFLDNKIIAAKRKVTEYENRFTRFLKSYNELFPVEDTHEYKMFIQTIKNRKERLEKLKKEKENYVRKEKNHTTK